MPSSPGLPWWHQDQAHAPDPAIEPAVTLDERRAPGVLAVADLDSLFDALGADGRRVVAPVVRDGAIVLDIVSGADDLPVGWHDEQEAGTYRLSRGADRARFGYAVGPTSLRRFLTPPTLPTWVAVRDDDGVRFESALPPVPRYAFVGVRACDLAALRARAGVPEPWAEQVRREAVVVAVQCTTSAATCFCASMGTGPHVDDGADLVLTEVLEPAHVFLVEARTDAGRAVADTLTLERADESLVEVGVAAVRAAASAQHRSLDAGTARSLLADHLRHEYWDVLGDRCLSCTNCTMVCPTCFCTESVTDTPLGSDSSTTSTRWDSCFTTDFTHLHGAGSVRPDTRAQYRQWLTHKLVTWWDQLDACGCVGCGRCITWCPVGIDLTAAVREFAEPG